MPDYSEAIKEAMVTAGNGEVIIETIELSHPLLAETLYLANCREDVTLTLEDDSEHLFEGVGFKLTLPPTGDSGLQELGIAIDNTDRRITDFANTVKGSKVPVTVKYRPYISTDLTQPQTAAPLVLFLYGMTITLYEASGRAGFMDIINRKFPALDYTRSRFPSLGE